MGTVMREETRYASDGELLTVQEIALFLKVVELAL
jgi:hypothetical protein